MPRIKKDDLEYCVKYEKCLDCYAKDKDTKAVRHQQRGKLRVPCCQKDFDDHERKMREVNPSKYARRAARKQKTGLCVYHGCHRKLIPREILPLRIRTERTCGLHGTFKASRLNRIAMSKFIIDHCLTAEQRKGMKLRNMVYKPGEPLAFIGLQYPRHYSTQCWSASELQRLYAEIHSK
jgi:hypothetical protein